MECLLYLIYSTCYRVIAESLNVVDISIMTSFSCTCFWTEYPYHVLDSDWVFWSTSLGQRLPGWEVDGNGVPTYCMYNHVQLCPFRDWHTFHLTCSAYARDDTQIFWAHANDWQAAETASKRNPLFGGQTESLLLESLKYDNVSRLLRRFRFDY